MYELINAFATLKFCRFEGQFLHTQRAKNFTNYYMQGWQALGMFAVSSRLARCFICAKSYVNDEKCNNDVSKDSPVRYAMRLLFISHRPAATARD